jgi:hypothetical protein
MVRYNDKPIDAAMYQRCGFWGRGWEQNMVCWKYNSNTAGWNIPYSDVYISKKLS